MAIQCPAGSKPYVIKSGDTLYAIASNYQTTVKAILAANPGIHPRNLRVGQVICIPTKQQCPLYSIPYTIQAGDTFYSLSIAAGVELSEMFRVNPGVDPNNLQEGQVICLPYIPTKKQPGKCKWAGVRESVYGVAQAGIPFPSPQGWANAMNHMAAHWAGSVPTTVWLVSEVDFSTSGTTMQFSSPGGTYDPLIEFNPNIIDHEPYLNYFDTHGIKAILQVEPGFASITDQIDAVLRKFGHHSCVIGFGIDVEWDRKASATGTNASVTDALAKQWETQVKSYNRSYRLMLKHFEEKYLPPTYRGDIIFCCDDENNGSFSTFLFEHKKMADFCNPNPVFYQIGYPSDFSWWSAFPDPPKTLGDALIAQTNPGQDCGLFWVDYTLNTLPL